MKVGGRTTLYVGTAVLTVAFVLLLLAEETNLYAIAAIGIAGAVFLAAHPRTLAIAALIAVLFAQSIEHFSGGSALSLVDDGLVILAIVALPLGAVLNRRKLRGFPRLMAILALTYLALGVLSCFINDVPLATAAAGTYLAARPFLLAFALLQVPWTRDDGARIGRVGVVILWIVVACGAINLVIPTQWTAIFASNPVPEYNGFVPGLVGPFAHPSFFGQALALGVIFLVAYRLHVGKKHTALICVAGALSLLSFRRKTLVSLPAGVLQVLIAKRPGLTWAFLVLLAPIAAFAAWPQIVNLWAGIAVTYFAGGGEDNARTALTVQSADVANTYAPFGAGFGRYGSSVAASDYSPEYLQRGFQNIYGLEPAAPRFASDTFWPQVIGESGWIGFAAFAALVVVVWLYFIRMARGGDQFEKMVGAGGAGWVVMLTVESIAAPTFGAPPTYAMIPAVLAFAIATRNTTGTEVVSADSAKDQPQHRNVVA
jgi:hypothetical protein